MLSHEELLQRLKEKTVSVGIEPAIARQFYCDFSDLDRQNAIADPRSQEALMVRGLQGLDAAIFLIAAGLSIAGFGYWSALTIPLLWGYWIFLKGPASLGSTTLRSAFVLLGIWWTIGFAFFRQDTFQLLFSLVVPLICLGSIYAYRFAAERLKQLILTSPAAYAFLVDKPLGQRGVFVVNNSTQKLID